MTTRTPSARRSTAPTTADVAVPGVLIGLGLGGLFDGILLHQILQWHHMLSSEHSVHTVEGLKANTLGDGLFHAVTWIVLVAGIALLSVRATRAPLAGPRPLWGWMLVGWGSFNLVEGLIDHQILRVHHVRPGDNELAWDLAYLALGAVLVAAGLVLARGRGHRADHRG